MRQRPKKLCWFPFCDSDAVGTATIVCRGDRATVQACERHKDKSIAANFTRPRGFPNHSRATRSGVRSNRNVSDAVTSSATRLSLFAAVLLLSLGLGMDAQAQPPQFYGWYQPAKPQLIVYPTPIRDLLFGRARLVPTGPPVPYYLVPGRLVPPTIVYPPGAYQHTPEPELGANR